MGPNLFSKTTQIYPFEGMPAGSWNLITAMADDAIGHLHTAVPATLGNHFQRAAAISRQVRICRIKRPEGSFMLDELADLIERDFE